MSAPAADGDPPACQTLTDKGGILWKALLPSC